MHITRRKFLKTSAFAGLGAAIANMPVLSAPSVLTRPRVPATTVAGEAVFTPVFTQRGRGPHLLDWAYASDVRWDAFHSNIAADHNGVRISDVEGHGKFGINVRWDVEGFGYTFLTADNGGEFYTLPTAGKTKSFNLNFELASSRVARNRSRLKEFEQKGYTPSREVRALIGLSDEYLNDAKKAAHETEHCGVLSDRALYHALWGSEALEIDVAKHEIRRRGRRGDFYVGCNARAVVQMSEDIFFQRFNELFDYATITYVWKDRSAMGDFEPAMGDTRYDLRDLMFDRLRHHGLMVTGRCVTWFHKWSTPDFIRRMDYDALRKYVENHTRELVKHYGDGMFGWELINEFHDWANEVQLNPEQIIELTRLMCDVAKDAAPSVHRIVNHCCPYAEYVQLKEWSGQPARYRQRTPWQFTKELIEAGVDFTMIGQQMYYPYRDLQDCIVYLERFEQFKKVFHISEIGCPGGPSNASVMSGKVGFPKEPYPWHRPWDDELLADWTESMYTLAYSKPFISGCVWHDFVDTDAYIDNGGFLQSFKGETKPVFDRLASLVRQWKTLPRTPATEGSHD